MNEKKIIKTLNNQKNLLPIWIMRQAGRYLPEYREIRSRVNNFLELCYNPILASEVTLQPIRRFDFDAAIIFSDILVIPDALGIDVKFVENIGPIVEVIDSLEKLKKIDTSRFLEKLLPVYETIKISRKSLSQNKALIGFVGSPWTVATYILQGRSSKDFSGAKILAYNNPELVDNLINMLVEYTIIHLHNQINAGADIIQLFDSWAGILDSYLFDKYVIEPTRIIVDSIRKLHPNIPIIGFPKGANIFYSDYIKKTKINAVGIDSSFPIKKMIEMNSEVVIQGNLDSSILFAKKETIYSETIKILDATKDIAFIFNLGHGILPKTPIENVEYLIQIVRNYN